MFLIFLRRFKINMACLLSLLVCCNYFSGFYEVFLHLLGNAFYNDIFLIEKCNSMIFIEKLISSFEIIFTSNGKTQKFFSSIKFVILVLILLRKKACELPKFAEKSCKELILKFFRLLSLLFILLKENLKRF